LDSVFNKEKFDHNKGCTYDLGLKFLNNIPQMSEETICKALNINYDLKTFKLFNIIQALIHNTKVSRCDDDNKKMKTFELKDFATSKAFVENHIMSAYNNKYAHELHLQNKQEKDVIVKDLVLKMLRVDSLPEFIKLFKEGISKGKAKAVIADSSKLGFFQLKQGLVTNNCLVNEEGKEDKDLPKEKVALRFKKLEIILLGIDLENPKDVIWNGGNIVRKIVEEVKKAYLAEGISWDAIQEYMKSAKVHVYRELPNRHSHCNEKPSYWAFGFDTLSHYHVSVSAEEWEEYKKTHSKCCGVSKATF